MKKLLVIAVLAMAINALGQIPTDGLIGYWPFSGSANDLSNNAFHGVVYGAMLTTDRFGNPNSAYHFDGISAYITLNNDMPVIQSLDFTISAWAKMDGLSGGLNREGIIFEQRHDLVTETSSTIVLIPENKDGNTWFMARTNTGAREEIIGSPVGYGYWHHYIASVGSDDTLRFYIDGLEIGREYYAPTGNF
ncbi:MAG TPA: LamG-like jellyroll fold domain-containing protein, partial [Saprospiraceae bacterium]|nr:LamG-like jellyroll fold domain-containing protein [Saprospiraceae bacterium]